MTAAAIMHLQEQKKLNITDPVTKYIPNATNFVSGDYHPVSTYNPGPDTPYFTDITGFFSEEMRAGREKVIREGTGSSPSGFSLS